MGVAASRAQSLREHRSIRGWLWVLVILICLATVFLKQDSIVDVVCGVALSLTMVLAVRRWNPGPGLLRLVLPKKERRMGSRVTG